MARGANPIGASLPVTPRITSRKKNVSTTSTTRAATKS
jgi:hypothetical protein